MADPVSVIAVAMPTGVVIGWLAKHFGIGSAKNGNGMTGKLDVVITKLDQIVQNTNSLPDYVKESRLYYIEGRIAMERIRKIDEHTEPE